MEAATSISMAGSSSSKEQINRSWGGVLGKAACRSLAHLLFFFDSASRNSLHVVFLRWVLHIRAVEVPYG